MFVYSAVLQALFPAPLQKLVGELFLIFCREIWRGFCGIFSDPQNNTFINFGEIFGAFFVRKFVPQKKKRANFVLQTCPSNKLKQIKSIQA